MEKAIHLLSVRDNKHLPDNYTEGVSKTQRYKMIGNGWTVDKDCTHIERLRKNINNGNDV